MIRILKNVKYNNLKAITKVDFFSLYEVLVFFIYFGVETEQTYTFPAF